MNKKTLVILISVLVVCILGLIIANGFWSKPVEVQTLKTGLVVLSPSANQEVSLPIEITGYVNGDGWIGFEGQVGSVKLVIDGVVLAQVPLMAKGDWMTESPINFETNISGLSVNCSSGSNCIVDGDANLVFYNENPSGDISKDKTFVLPIKIVNPEGETSTVKLYFMENNDWNIDCKPSSFVERIIPKTQAIARAALEELLKGPNNIERNNDFDTVINTGVKIQILTIDEQGVARVDFSQELESTGGSCRVAAIRAQITQTLKQFPTIKDVIISINGRTEDILQP